ncbi:MAG: TonB family protein [Myxococcota bacterium]|jgi:TonB family protein|nr:TonB family protein [Myxococcota bacterium]
MAPGFSSMDTHKANKKLLKPSTRRQKLRWQRHIARRRYQANLQVSPEKINVADPLLKNKDTSLSRLGKAGAWLTGSLAAHLLILFIFSTGLFSGFLMRSDNTREAPVEIVVQEIKKKPPEQASDVEAKKEAEEKPEPKPKKKPEPPKPKPKVAEEKPPEPPQKVRRIIGLSMESTVSGSGGPAFAVGNTQMGATDKTAVDPNAITKLDPSLRNQKATQLPIGGRLVKPKRIAEVKPVYPDLLRTQGIEADVVVVVSIAASGKVKAVKIAKPSKYPEFNQAARAAALKETFIPAKKDGVPTAYTLQYTYRFRLDEM